MFFKVFFKISQNPQEQPYVGLSHFNKVAGLNICNFIKKKKWLRNRCFPVNFTKFLRTAFLQNTFGRLLLYVIRKYWKCEKLKTIKRLNWPGCTQIYLFVFPLIKLCGAFPSFLKRYLFEKQPISFFCQELYFLFHFILMLPPINVWCLKTVKNNFLSQMSKIKGMPESVKSML